MALSQEPDRRKDSVVDIVFDGTFEAANDESGQR